MFLPSQTSHMNAFSTNVSHAFTCIDVATHSSLQWIRTTTEWQTHYSIPVKAIRLVTALTAVCLLMKGIENHYKTRNVCLILEHGKSETIDFSSRSTSKHSKWQSQNIGRCKRRWQDNYSQHWSQQLLALHTTEVSECCQIRWPFDPFPYQQFIRLLLNRCKHKNNMILVQQSAQVIHLVKSKHINRENLKSVENEIFFLQFMYKRANTTTNE